MHKNVPDRQGNEWECSRQRRQLRTLHCSVLFWIAQNLAGFYLSKVTFPILGVFSGQRHPKRSSVIAKALSSLQVRKPLSLRFSCDPLLWDLGLKFVRAATLESRNRCSDSMWNCGILTFSSHSAIVAPQAEGDASCTRSWQSGFYSAIPL